MRDEFSFFDHFHPRAFIIICNNKATSERVHACNGRLIFWRKEGNGKPIEYSSLLEFAHVDALALSSSALLHELHQSNRKESTYVCLPFAGIVSENSGHRR